MANNNLVILDVKSLMRELGEYSPDKDEIIGTCECGAKVHQTENLCSECQRQVVWRNSSVWRELHGNAEMQLRELRKIKPDTEAARLFCKLANITGFDTQADMKLWYSAEKLLGVARMNNISNYVCVEQRKGGIAATAHAFNIIRRAMQEARAVKEPADIKPQSVDVNHWRNRFNDEGD